MKKSLLIVALLTLQKANCSQKHQISSLQLKIANLVVTDPCLTTALFFFTEEPHFMTTGKQKEQSTSVESRCATPAPLQQFTSLVVQLYEAYECDSEEEQFGKTQETLKEVVRTVIASSLTFSEEQTTIQAN